MNATVGSAPGAPPASSWGHRLLWLVLAGVGFFALYGTANRYAASLPADSVGNIALGWEHALMPFWPWTILPYWSVDLLFAVSIVIGKSRREVRVQAGRLILITLIASLCFIAWPLRFGWDRPAVDGVFGAMFTALGMIDQPFNQAPSLHIALLYAIWRQLATHTPTRWRWLVHGWCALIGVSVLTTWQHHLLDVPTGLALGVTVCYALPMSPHAWRRWSTAAPVSARTLAWRYGAGALVFTLVALSMRGWMWLALWPALALWMLALGYARLGPAIFQKQGDGRSTLAARWLLLPYRLGAWVSWQWQRRALPAADHVTDDILLGSRPARTITVAVTGILDLCPELPPSAAVRDLAYRAVPMLDLLPPNRIELAHAVAVLESLRRQGPVLVHCALGRSRSATVVAAWLLAHDQAVDVEHAIARIARARPGVVLHASHRQALLDWSASCH